MIDKEKLNLRIEESGLKRHFIAEQMGISYMGFYKKVKGTNEFKASEIAKLKSLLNLSSMDVDEIFLQSK